MISFQDARTRSLSCIQHVNFSRPIRSIRFRNRRKYRWLPISAFGRSRKLDVQRARGLRMTSKVDLNRDEREWNTDTHNERARLAFLFHSWKEKRILRTISSSEIGTWKWRVLESIHIHSHVQESIFFKVRMCVFMAMGISRKSTHQ